MAHLTHMRRRGSRIAAALIALTVLASGCASTSGEGVTHVLRSGETIYRLSQFYGVPVKSIVRANRIRDVSNIPVGTPLFIPGAKRRPPSQTLAVIGPGEASASDLRNRAQREASLEFNWPIRGQLNSRFGWRSGRRHEGVDIGAKSGTVIRASESGRVILSGKLGDYGRVVIVKHAGRYSSVYAHNRRNKVKKGAFVEKGDAIAEVGSSGNASGPHLHFEIRRDRKPQDPLAFLR